MANHHMNSICACGNIKNNRAERCSVCSLKSGDARRGTGKYQPYQGANGYVWIYCPTHRSANKGYVQEHIIILEQKLGRSLYKGEICHHINGVKDDNRPENLESFQSNGEHVKHHSIGRFKGWTWGVINGRRLWYEPII